mgnify:CR=1 FL=1
MYNTFSEALRCGSYPLMIIYIANLSKNTTPTDFWDKFSNIGMVRQVEIVRAADAEEGKDFVMVELDSFHQLQYNDDANQVYSQQV